MSNPPRRPTALSRLAKWLSAGTDRKLKQRRLRAGLQRYQFESLERRNLLAQLSATGTTLNIFLTPNEIAHVRSDGSTYALTTNGGFTDGGVTNAAEFNGFGTAALTVLAPALARYDRLSFTDTANNRIFFDNSGLNTYGDSIFVRFVNSGPFSVTFDGMTSLGPGRSIDVDTTGGVNVLPGATVQSVDGAISLVATDNVAVQGQVLSTSGAVTLRADSEIFNGGTMFVSPQTWTEQTVLSRNSASFDGFGDSVAISADGNTAIVGSPYASTGSAGGQGVATVFVKSGATWALQQELRLLDAEVLDRFGTSVALSADGNTAVVSVPNRNLAGIKFGSVAVFNRSGSSWTQSAELTQRVNGALPFANVVAISGDGQTILAGAGSPSENLPAYVTVYRKLPGGWFIEDELKPNDVEAGDSNGSSLAISFDGNTVIIGAETDDVGSKLDQGSATVFVRSGAVWSQQQKLIAPDGRHFDQFGAAVSISADGNTVVVGSPYADIGNALDQGSAMVFSRTGNSWSIEQSLIRTDGFGSQLLGGAVSLSADGSVVLLGGRNGSSNVVPFTRGGKIWSQSVEITAANTQGSDLVGYSVAISSDGSTAVIGAPSSPITSSTGTVRTYALNLKNGRVAAGSGQLTVSAFSVDVQGTMSAGSISFAPSSIIMPISLGAEAQAFSLTELELDRISTPNLKFISQNGDIGVTFPITRRYPTNMEFSAGVNYLGFYGVNAAGGDITIYAGDNIGVTGDIVSLGGNIAFLADDNNNGVGELTVINNLGGIGNIITETGQVTIHAAQYVNNAAGTIVAGSIVVLGSRDVAIELGPTTQATSLNLSQSELNQMRTSNLQIGWAASGPITINDVMTRSSPTNLLFAAGLDDDLTFGPFASINSQGGDVRLDVVGTGGITSGSLAVDVITGTGKVTINAEKGNVGTPANPLVFTGARFTSTGGTSNISVMASATPSPVSVVAPGFGAGTGTLQLTGEFTGGNIDPRTSLTLQNASWTINTPQTVAGFKMPGGQLFGTGSLSTSGKFEVKEGFIQPTLTGTGELVQLAGGATQLLAANTYTGKTTVNNGGRLVLGNASALGGSPLIDLQTNGTLDTSPVSPDYTLTANQTLTGIGGIRGPIVGVAGTHVAPGNNLGTLTTNKLRLDGATLDIEANSPIAGRFDQLNVVGTVTLTNNPVLNVILQFQPQLSTVFKIINNDSTDAVVGTFAGLQEGALLSVVTGSFLGDFKISYIGGDGNDVTLSSVEGVAVTASPINMSEEGGSTVGTVRRFNTDISVPLTVTLSSVDTTEATVPPTVVIPAGSDRVTFPITAVDDDLLDGTQSVTIQATSAIGQGQYTIQVTDSEWLTISLIPDVREGETTTATVTRSNTDIDTRLFVVLNNSNLEAFTQGSVDILAGQSSATFTITGRRDAKLDGTQVSIVSASHFAYRSRTSPVNVLDAESLTVTIDKTSISESAGTAVGTVKRSNNQDMTQPVTIDLVSSDPSEATVPATVTILAGQESVTFPITAVDDSLLDGPQTVTITATNPLYYNSGAQSLTVTDFETLTLSIDKSSIAEPSETAIATVTRSNTDNSAPLTITITNPDTSEITVPTSVTIPAGLSGATFVISALADNLLDGTQSVVLRVDATGYEFSTKSINVTDGEFLSVQITTSPISEAGGTTTATVRRSNTNITQALSVNLTSSDTTEATVPATVTIPAGVASVNFTITAVDDALLDGTQNVTIGAAANGYLSGSAALQVTDREVLGISLAGTTMSENGGTLTGTVVRSNTDITQPITIFLASSDTSEATVPVSVSLAANQISANFTIQAVDDNLLDGTQTVVITASSPGYVDISTSLDVTDAESLSLAFVDTSINENGGKTNATLTRSNTDVNAALVVTLTSSDITEATVPATVTIPAGQPSISFEIVAVDDTLLDGTQPLTISAAVAGYASANQLLNVTDYETLSVTIDDVSISEAGSRTSGTVRRNNTDISLAITVDIVSGDTSEATVDARITIPAGQPTATFSIFSVDDTLLDGTQTVTFTASSAGYVSGSNTLQVTDSESLGLSFSVGTISEQGGTATATVTRSNTDIGLPLTVLLTSSDTTEATVPASVTILANQSSATFIVTGVDDNLLDGPQAVDITASASGYNSISRVISVTDAETVVLSINKTNMSETGGTATGTVTRTNSNITSALTVLLSSSDTTEATVPTSVVIPANATSADFTIAAVDDVLLDGPQVVTLTANATGYTAGTATITVDDAEFLSLTINATSISEKGGQATATVSRSNANMSQPVVVSLASGDTSELTVPATVTILANQPSVTFTVTAVDDDLLDGTQSVSFTASAAGYLSGSRSLNVTDFETLAISFAKPSIAENGETVVATVSRSNTNVDAALTVQLQSSDTSEATVPTSVTIPAGSTSTTVTVSAVDDTLLDGSQTAIITLSAAGYQNGSGSLQITDVETLAVTIDPTTISENGGTAQATVTRSNTDTGSAITVFLSTSDANQLNVPSSVTIPANQASATVSIAAKDNNVLDGIRTVDVVATAFGYSSGSKPIAITDFETLSITLDRASMTEAGGTAVGRVTRNNTNIGSPLTVQLSSSDLSEATVPASVTIPADQAFVEFTITAVDDSLLDGTQSALLTATATGYQTATQAIDVTDVESLSLSISVTEISEKDGTASATITRSNTDTAQPLTVNLTSSDTSEATVPTTVVIPAGSPSTTFSITAVDDALLDGTVSVTISASAVSYVGASASLGVSDVESLLLTLQQSSISEAGGSTVATVRRSNTNIDLPLTVQLTATNASQVSVPTTVTIPAGRSEVTFNLAAIDDALLDGTQTVQVSASASGYSGSTATVDVLDAEAITLTIDQTAIDEVNGRAVATVTRSNTDNAQALIVSIGNNRPDEVSVPSSVTIPAGQASTTFEIVALNDQLLDGAQLVTLLASTSGYANGSSSLTVNDILLLDLVLNTTSVREDGSAIRARVSRSNTNISQPLTVQLQSSDTSEVTVPASVTIPAAAAFVEFDLTPVDDALLDGAQSVSVSASSSGYRGSAATLNVTDAELLDLTLDRVSFSESGGTAQGTVQRSNTDTTLPLTVTLSNSDSTEASLPTTVTIPAGQRSVSFTISAVDDTLLDGVQTISVHAQAVGYLDGPAATKSLNVDDAESLTISLAPAAMSENGGQAQGTVTRSNTDLNQPLTVNVGNSDASEVNVPSSVTIPAGQSSVTFVISAVDDSLLDGVQVVNLHVQAAGYVDGSAAIGSINVEDAESLSITIDKASISENGGRAQATITRSNTDLDKPQLVNLISRDTSEASVPSQATIPAGQASVTVTISGVDDALLDGTQSVQIDVQAAGYSSSSASLQVTDEELLTVTFAAASISEKNGSVTVVVHRSNTDFSLPLVVALVSSDTSELTVPASVTIAANQTEVSVQAQAVDERVIDGTATVEVQATALGYLSGVGSVQVTDNDPEFPWQNPRNPLDVNDDGFVTPLDALLVINALNIRFQLPPELPVPFDPVQYLDVDANALVTPIDALLVINQLNRQVGGEAESPFAPRKAKRP